MVKAIPTNRPDKFALVDDHWYDSLSQYRWTYMEARSCVCETGYALRRVKGRTVYMHHLIAGFPPAGMVVDHEDGDGLNNTESNLRHITRGQNFVKRHRREVA